MTLETLNGLGNGGAHQNTRLPRILAELQGLQVSLVAGAASNDPMVDPKGPLFGQDTIVAAWLQQPDGFGVLSDITSTHSIIDTFPSGTMTVGAAIANGHSCVINGHTYTAVTVTPTTTYSGLADSKKFYTGLKTGESANGIVLTKAQLIAGGATNAEADLLLASANKEEYIAAWSLARAINATDQYVTASAPTALNSGVVTIRGRVEEATLTLGGGAMTSGTQLTRGAATITGGAVGKPTGTITVSAVDNADYVTVGDERYTFVTYGDTVYPTLNQVFALAAADITVGANCNARKALVRTGLSAGEADELLTTADIAHANKACAYLLAWTINANDGANFTATSALAVVTVVQDAEDGVGAGSEAVLTTSDGGDLAVSGGGTLTATARGWKNSGSEAQHYIMVFWFKKSRALGQW